jgi:hypothetical protein
MQAEEALKLIMDKKFVLDCPQMLLSPQLSTSSRKSYSGAGFVTQNPEGGLVFKIYCNDGVISHSRRHYPLRRFPDALTVTKS